MTNSVLTTLCATRLRAHHDAGHWQDDTIYQLVRRQMTRTPDRVAIRERARSVTYGELVDAADRLAAALRTRGVRTGQRVAVWVPSRAETAVVLLACSRNGYVSCPSLHRDHTVSQIIELLERMGAAALIAQPGYGADAARHDVFLAADELEDLQLVIGLPEADAEQRLFPDLAHGDAGEVRDDPDTVVYLAFTSGSTGEPKGVMHSDNTLLAPVRALSRDWALGEESVVYSLSPLSHNLGFGAMVLALTRGGELVVHDLPRGQGLADRLRAVGATFAFGVPTHAIDLLEEIRRDPAAAPTALRGFRISGARAPTEVVAGLLEHGITPQSGYGMTEAGSHHYTLPDDDAELITTTSGRPCDGHEARVFSQDDPDVELPPGEVGQIGGRGASLMLGYFDDQRRTEQSFNRDGWFLSGDLGWADEQGYLRITGRKKDLIIRGGHNIYPARIEDLAARHVGVGRAAAIPVPDDRLGEKVCLVVVPAEGHGVDPPAILAHLDAEGLSRYDMPEYVAELEAIPLLPSGKVAKRRLLDLLDAGELTLVPVRFEPGSGT